MEYRLLGPVEVVAGAAQVPLGGLKPQTLLAALLLEHGRVVPLTRLIDILWPGDPPETAKAAIHTYVKSLRQALARHGADGVIVTRAPGYLVELAPDSLDLHVFEQLLAGAHRAEAAEEVSRLLTAALALWRGPALAGLGDSLLSGEAERLEQLRLGATERRVAADLVLGRHGQVVAELAALVARHPANERLRGQYMTALYGAGRQSDALAAFEEGRAALSEELGVDPGPELTSLHRAILRGDPALMPPAAPDRPQRTAPAQLPVAPADFTGRADQTDALIAALTPAPGAAVHVIAGRGGSGKSALAVHVAHQVKASFPDGQLYAELRGMGDAPAEPGEVLGRMLKALGVEFTAMPAAAAERAELYRSLLAGRRLLVVLDDAADEQQVRPLLPGDPGCAVLVTGRNRLGGLSGARRIDLDVLGPQDALDLLGRIVGADRAAAEPAAAQAIVELCGHLPLAICIAGARLATRQRWPLRLLADRLADEQRRLDELTIADLQVRAGFELSYRGLDEPARRALRRLGYLGVPEFSSWIPAWLTDTAETAAEDVVEQLVDAHLVDFSHVDGLGRLRYRLHELVRLYARERAEAEESAGSLSAAVSRVLSGWLTLADQVTADAPADAIGWARPVIEARPMDAGLLAQVRSAPHTWFDLEHAALVVGLERAAVLGLHDLVCLFASARLGPSFLGVNRFEARERINQAALAAAVSAGDRRGEAIMLAELGHLRYLQDRFPESRQHFTEALAAFREHGDGRGMAVALIGLGAGCREAGRLVEALHFLDQGGDRVRELGDDIALGYLHRLAGSVRLELGDYEQVRTDLKESLAAYQRAGSQRGEGLTLRTLSMYHRAVGEYEEAVETAMRAQEIFTELGDALMEAYAVRSLAKARLRRGESAGVLAQLEHVLTVCHAMGDRLGHAVTMRTVGELHLAEGRLDEAYALLDAALRQCEQMDVPLWQARTERDLALLHEARGESEAAAALRAKAVRTFRAFAARESEELTGGVKTY
ncbi:BTAD domain-containing putative transcriptional regulator [Catellatospora sp. KI3]|uniref:AfsR/SARP family transcriptional regulator n=1 Tax=Catellatospora sp. KI3 TaxID=3041620 RepID=UPI0024827B02|nr:AfsR/SARP family transcriptional regulator [Catellatospora sp. KI3]MDI1464108.1 BTAD domain-containing putative transcriptional regulator [Catellatospora sp. KI3]